VDLGLYESLLTDALSSQLGSDSDGSPDLRAIDPADQPHVLARHVYEVAQRVLSSTSNETERIEVVNRLLAELRAVEDSVLLPASQLLRIATPSQPGATVLEDVRPSIPLSEAALLTNAKSEPSLGAELRAEIDTADEVDLLCAFVKWHGLRLLEPQLRRLSTRLSPLRVITTTYMGATERAALDRLIRELGAEVKVQYDAQRTRLHA
jgi:hypothetical protein